MEGLLHPTLITLHRFQSALHTRHMRFARPAADHSVQCRPDNSAAVPVLIMGVGQTQQSLAATLQVQRWSPMSPDQDPSLWN